VEGSDTESSGSTPPDRGWPFGPTALERRLGNGPTRIIAAVIAIPLIGLILMQGGIAFTLFVAVMALGALYELYTLLKQIGLRPFVGAAMAAGAVLIFFFHGWTNHGSAVAIDGVVAVALFAATLLILFIGSAIASLRREHRQGIADVAATFMGVVYVPLFLSSLLPLYHRVPGSFLGDLLKSDLAGTHESNGAIIVLTILSGIWICDSAAYFGGKALGKHKLMESVSPKKTWEGAISGLLFGMIAMSIAIPFLFDRLTIVDGIIIGAIIGVVGQLGDLFESHIKRASGIKDSSQIIPGHGGLLDRFDSLIVVAPTVLIYLIIRSMIPGLVEMF
jgi:phosphatidate cytidylyltransferase